MSFFSKFVREKIERARAEMHDGVITDGINGYEHPDPTPMAPPIGYKKQPSIWEQQKALIRSVRLEEHNQGMETFEESDDFDVDDDFEPSTPFEKGFDLSQEPLPAPPVVPPPLAAAPPQPVAPEAPPAAPMPPKAP